MPFTQDQGMHRDSNNIIHGPYKEIPSFEGVGTMLFKSMKNNKDNLAQIDAITGQKQTYTELLDKCIKACLYIQSKGVKPNDVVSICSFNHLDTIVPFVGTLFAGAVIACTDPRLSLIDTTCLLEQVRPKLIFVSENAVDLIEKVLERKKVTAEIVVFGESNKHTEFKVINSVKYDGSFSPHAIKDTRDTAVITFSSGTTGYPKGICLSHFGLQAVMLVKDGEIEHKTLFVSSSPYWITGVYSFLRIVLYNANRLITPDFDETEIWKWITDYKVAAMVLAPAQLVAMSKIGRPAYADVSSVETISTGGVKISKEQILKIRSLFPNSILYYKYALTETSGLALSLIPIEDPANFKTYHEQPNTIGRPKPFCTYKIVDIETGEKLGPNKLGELRVKTLAQMNGYYNLDSSSCWDSEGFIKTGDLVYYDEELNFFYVDRIKEMLKFRGWQISPMLLENIISNHPAVRNVVVVGKSHLEDGDRPVAVVERMKPVTEEEIANFLAAQVADTHRLSGGVKFVDKIPVSVTGKNRRVFIKNLVNNNQLMLVN